MAGRPRKQTDEKSAGESTPGPTEFVGEESLRREPKARIPWFHQPVIRVLAGAIAVLVVSLIMWQAAWKNYIAPWGAHIGGDTRSYAFYSAFVFSGQEFSAPLLSDIYYFRTWGYPWVLWQYIREESPANKPPGGYTRLNELEWTVNPDLYRRLIFHQALLWLLLPVGGYFLVWLMTRSVGVALVPGMYLAFFIEPLGFARWVIPDGPITTANVLAILCLAGAAIVPRWWVGALLALVAGVLAAFNAMVRYNLVVVLPVVWIAAALVAFCLIALRVKDKWPWIRLAIVPIGVTIPFLLILKVSEQRKAEYAGAERLSDGLARMGTVSAAFRYKELDPEALTQKERIVRDQIMNLPRQNPRLEYWPEFQNWLNGKAAAVGMDPVEYREVLVSLNKKVILRNPLIWFKSFSLPAYTKETYEHFLDGEWRGRAPLKDTFRGKLFGWAKDLRVALHYLVNPTTLLVVGCLVMMVARRRDWRATFIILVLTGTHLASMLTSALLGIPAGGRYRFVTEPLYLMVVLPALVYTGCWLVGSMRGLWSELRGARARSISSSHAE